MQIYKYIIAIIIIALVMSPILVDGKVKYVPKRIIECQNAFIGVSIETQEFIDKKYHCRKLWGQWTREILLTLPK